MCFVANFLQNITVKENFENWPTFVKVMMNYLVMYSGAVFLIPGVLHTHRPTLCFKNRRAAELFAVTSSIVNRF